MIYLIQDCYKNDKGEYVDILKIGYSSKSFSESRENSYKSENYGFKFLGEREGDIELEGLFHDFYSQNLLEKGTEWMSYSENVIDEFFNLEKDKLIQGTLEKLGKVNFVKQFRPFLIRKEIESINKSRDYYIKFYEDNITDDVRDDFNMRFYFRYINYLIRMRYLYNNLLEMPFLKALPDDSGTDFRVSNKFLDIIFTKYSNELRETKVNEELVIRKDKKTNNILGLVNKLSSNNDEEVISDLIEKLIGESELYKNDYLGVSKRTGKLLYNHLAQLIEAKIYKIS